MKKSSNQKQIQKQVVKLIENSLLDQTSRTDNQNMNKSAKTWLLFMMVPFFVGVLIHFLVPLQVIISANPKLQDSYNGYKIQVEQSTVRALAFLNSRVITNRLQMYENIHSTLFRLYERGATEQSENQTQIYLLNAMELANSNSTVNYNQSMWYSPQFSSLSNMTQQAQSIYDPYAQMEPYLQSIFTSDDEIYQGMVNFQMVINYNDTLFDFQYPAVSNSKYTTLGANILTECYNLTLGNYYNDGFLMTMFDMGKTMRMCTVMILPNDTTLVNGTNYTVPRGTICVALDIQTVIRDITSVLGVPEFQLSTNDYYLLRPLYSTQNPSNPEIIAHFSSTNLSVIDIPLVAEFSLSENPLPRKIFLSTSSSYSLNIQRHERTKTFYTIPIVTSNYDDSTQVAFFLVVLNNFAKAELSEQSRNQKIAVIMAVPSVSLLLLSIIATTLILRSILKKLDNALGLMGEYCSLIKKGDLKLEIPQYQETQDLKQLFQKLQKLNQLNKYAHVQYFQVPKPERIIRLLKCVKLFDELQYDKTNLYENISQCYMAIGEYQSAIKYLKESIKMTIDTFYGNQMEITRRYELRLNKKITKVDKATLKKDKIIKRKVLRLCYILHALNKQSNNPQNLAELAESSQLVRKITYPDILNSEYISCLFFIVSCKMRMRDFTQIKQNIDILYDLITGYEQLNEGNESCDMPPDLFFSYWHSLCGNICLAKKDYVEAYQLFVKALQGDHFNPNVHGMIIQKLTTILSIFGISKEEFNNFKFMDQYKPRSDREYIFLFDVGKPDMNIHEVNVWKKKARKMVQHIFTKLILDNDRVSITEYCLDIKIVCNLIQKGNREKMLKKQLMSSIKARDQSINGLILPCLRKSIERARNLKREKIFLVFMKSGKVVDGNQIVQQIQNIENAKFFFFVDNPKTISDQNEQFYVMGYESQSDVERILQSKVLKQADNIVYIL